ncbi:MAG: hypothetical protein PF689_12040 [Deltaproteobacteria bacterium]|jgi:hypothetical protein|nr:hypothetical protein [Deltaproteobacteria bacterium]
MSIVLSSCSDDTQELCGNGAIDHNEQCDGDNLNQDSCESLGYTRGSLSCKSNCTFDYSGCEDFQPNCGNDVVDAGEQCDGGDLQGITCFSFGFNGGYLNCNDNCKFDTSSCLGNCPETCIINTKKCEGDILYLCEETINCNQWVEVENCHESDKQCIEDNFGNAMCMRECEGSCMEEGAVACSDDNKYVKTCVKDEDRDCLIWEYEDCDNGFCVYDEETNSTQCEDDCVDECEIVEDSTTLRCNNQENRVEICNQASNGCYFWNSYSQCESEEFCNPQIHECGLQGTGESCDSPLFIKQFPHTVDGSNLLTAFSDDATGFYQGSNCGNETAGVDLFLSIYLEKDESVLISNDGAAGFLFRLMSNCESGNFCHAWGITELLFTASESGLYYVVVEPDFYSVSLDFEFHVVKVPTLSNGDSCWPDNSYGVCSSDSFCAQDLQSSTGFSCQAISQGNDCNLVQEAQEGNNLGTLQGMEDNYDFEIYPSQSVEQVWSFSPTQSGTWLFTMENFDLSHNLYLSDICTEDATPFVFSSSDGSHSITNLVFLLGNSTVYVFAEKSTPPYSQYDPYNYNLNILRIMETEVGLCNDLRYNDLDGLIDCEDPDCFGDSTGCIAENICDDGNDNDLDGLSDCQDPDCELSEACLEKRGIYELFEEEDNPDLEGYRLSFTPVGNLAYELEVTNDATFFVEPGQGGTTVIVLDDYLYTFSLPFDFPFYGFEYSNVFVSSNGWMSFSDPGSETPFESIQLLFSNPMIAVMWDDLKWINYGDLFYIDWGQYSGVSYWAFTYYNREYNNPLNRLWAQVVLFEDGKIRIDYLENGISDGLTGISSPGNDPVPDATDFVTN